MSLRREEAELRRALQLSTQQVDALAHLPPYHLSSAPTDDSRDFELRPVRPNMTPQTPVGPQQNQYSRLEVLSPSPPFQVAHALGLNTSATRSSDTHAFPPHVMETPASRIETFGSTATEETPGSVINTFPRSLETPTAARTSRVEVVLSARRGDRGSSVDPIDSIPRTRTHVSPPPDAHVLVEASRSSGPSVSGPTSTPTTSSGSATHDLDPGRRSARVRDNKEKEAEIERKERDAKAERKRRREEEKAKIAAEEAQRLKEDANDGGEYVPGKPEKKRKTEKKKKPSQAKSTKSSQAKSDRSNPKSSQTSVKSSQEKSSSVPETAKLASVAEEHSSAPTTDQTSVQNTPEAPQSSGQRSKNTKNIEGPKTSSPEAEPSVSKSSASKSSAPPSSAPKSSASEPQSSVNAAEQPPSPVKPPTSMGSSTTSARLSTPASRTPLQPIKTTPGSRGSPITWKTSRNDLANVLANFPSAKRTGMSKRTRITSLHTTIGPPAKVLPPPPPKSRKKVEEEDEDSDTEGKVKVGSREWLMMED